MKKNESELEKLRRTLILPCQRRKWKAPDGKEHDVEITEADLVDERTWRSKRVIESYNCYQPKEFQGFLVHNDEILKFLPEAGTLEGLDELYKTAKSHDLFEAKRDRYGLVVTSTAEENPQMNINRWITDSIHNLDLIEDKEGKAIIIRMLATFYCTPTEESAFIRIIGNPKLFRDFRDPSHAKEGVAHIFQIENIEGKINLKRDPNWGNNRRLESHGLALCTFCSFLLGELAEEVRQPEEHEICKAIAGLGLYFQAIDYPTAPSAGAWEEIPLPGGLSWDTEAIRRGFVALKRLMLKTGDATIKSYQTVIRREALLIASRAGGSDMLFKNEEELEKELNELIERGRKQVSDRIRQKAEAPEMRSCDASLAFLAQSDDDLVLVENQDEYERTIETVQLYMELLKGLESRLVRKSGMIRYEPFSHEPGGEPVLFDSYLTANYWLSFDEEGYFNPIRTQLVKKFESSDTSDLEILKERNQLGISDREAEWFLITEMARGYAKQAQRLQTLERRQNVLELSKDQHKKVLKLFEKCKNKAGEYLTRGYARITPTMTVIKANGEKCHSWSIPEAYEWVRICANAVGKGETGFSEKVLPGANTSLAWAAASLKMATQEVRKLLV